MMNGAGPFVRPNFMVQGEEEYRGSTVAADEGKRIMWVAYVTLLCIFD